MSTHKFSVGEKVDFVPAFHQRTAPTTEYQVIRRLPDHDGECFYQIKNTREPHDRVVGESQLIRPPSADKRRYVLKPVPKDPKHPARSRASPANGRQRG